MNRCQTGGGRRWAGPSGALASLLLFLGASLGRAEAADRVEIRWPDGQVERLERVAADQVLTVVQGEAREPEP